MKTSEIIKFYLKTYGYDGLYSDNECACKLDDLVPCGELQLDCRAGYLTPCDGTCAPGDCDFHISATKEGEFKTSEEWQRLCRIEILDPDGWDRKKYQFSWYEEKITRQDFERRLVSSTVHFNVDYINNIWIDK